MGQLVLVLYSFCGGRKLGGETAAVESKACASPPKNQAQLARLRGAAPRAGCYVMAEAMTRKAKATARPRQVLSGCPRGRRFWMSRIRRGILRMS